MNPSLISFKICLAKSRYLCSHSLSTNSRRCLVVAVEKNWLVSVDSGDALCVQMVLFFETICTQRASGMHPGKYLVQHLRRLTSTENYMFSMSDLRALLPRHTAAAFKSILFRVETDGDLLRLCRGLYLYPGVNFPRGLVLYHAAARLRAHQFNYLSLESVLHDKGIISQAPLQWITIMSSGRSSVIHCAKFGSIEFVHTRKSPNEIASELNYDTQCRLWRASTKLAIRDMRLTKRSLDLVSMEETDAFV